MLSHLLVFKALVVFSPIAIEFKKGVIDAKLINSRKEDRMINEMIPKSWNMPP